MSATGGTATVTLTQAELPAISGKGLVQINGVNTFLTGDNSGGEFDNKDATAWPGTGAAHENLPPYKVKLWVQKL
jgi:hypothetical protein